MVSRIKWSLFRETNQQSAPSSALSVRGIFLSKISLLPLLSRSESTDDRGIQARDTPAQMIRHVVHRFPREIRISSSRVPAYTSLTCNTDLEGCSESKIENALRVLNHTAASCFGAETRFRILGARARVCGIVPPRDYTR